MLGFDATEDRRLFRQDQATQSESTLTEDVFRTQRSGVSLIGHAKRVSAVIRSRDASLLSASIGHATKRRCP